MSHLFPMGTPLVLFLALLALALVATAGWMRAQAYPLLTDDVRHAARALNSRITDATLRSMLQRGAERWTDAVEIVLTAERKSHEAQALQRYLDKQDNDKIGKFLAQRDPRFPTGDSVQDVRAFLAAFSKP